MIDRNSDDPRDVARPSELWRPNDVVTSASLSVDEKRALLAAWASDDRAILGDPTLRQLPNGAVVSLASILEALRQLDGRERASAAQITRFPDHRHDQILTRWRRRSPWRRTRDDDDDDPPPAAAAVSARHAPAWA